MKTWIPPPLLIPLPRDGTLNVLCLSRYNIFGEGSGTPLQYSCLENPMDGGAWWAAVHGVAKSWIRLSDFTFTFHFHSLEKEMATHSSVLAWRIQGTGEPGGLPSLGSHRVRHDWSDLAAAAVFRAWFLRWQIPSREMLTFMRVCLMTESFAALKCGLSH